MLRRFAIGLVATVVAVGALAAPVAAGRPTFTFAVRIGEACVTGQGLEDARHLGLLYTSSGRLKDRNRVTSSGTSFTICFFQPVLGRDRVVVKSGGQSRSFRVPALTPVIDRVTDTVTGHAKPGTNVDLTLFHAEGFAAADPYPREAAVDGQGDYSADFSDIGIVGADQVHGFWTNGQDSVEAQANASFITYGRVSSTVVGSARRGDDVRVTIMESNSTTRGVANGGMPTVFQYFEAVFIDADGNDAFPRRGDHIVAPFTGDADLLVPRMFVHADPARDRVDGACMPESWYQLWVFYGEIAPAIRIGVTDANGDFSRKVGIDLQRGQFMTLNCRYPTGDFVFLDQEV